MTPLSLILSLTVHVILINFCHSAIDDTIPASCRYVNCYKDKPEDRILKGLTEEIDFSVTKYDMTVDWCIEYCTGKGFKYSGLGVGVKCFCGNRFEWQPELSVECGTACGGIGTVFCGGTRDISIYECDNVSPNGSTSTVSTPTSTPNSVSTTTSIPNPIICQYGTPRGTVKLTALGCTNLASGPKRGWYWNGDGIFNGFAFNVPNCGIGNKTSKIQPVRCLLKSASCPDEFAWKSIDIRRAVPGRVPYRCCQRKLHGGSKSSEMSDD